MSQIPAVGEHGITAEHAEGEDSLNTATQWTVAYSVEKNGFICDLCGKRLSDLFWVKRYFPDTNRLALVA